MDKDSESISQRDDKDIFYPSLIMSILILFMIFAPTRTESYVIEMPYSQKLEYTDFDIIQSSEPYTMMEPYTDIEIYHDKIPVEKTRTDEEFFDAAKGDYQSCKTGCVCTEYDDARCVQCRCEYQTTYTAYETIDKERPVTRYNNITRYRNITRIEEVKKTLDILILRNETMQKEVHWLLGTNMPYRLHLYG